MPLDNGNGNGKPSGTRLVDTPLGPGCTLYPLNLYPDSYPERHLLWTILDRARQDADWLDALEARPPSTWTLHERRRYARMLLDVVDPRDWLAA